MWLSEYYITINQQFLAKEERDKLFTSFFFFVLPDSQNE
jgi:hypothetical protein